MSNKHHKEESRTDKLIASTSILFSVTLILIFMINCYGPKPVLQELGYGESIKINIASGK